MVCYRFVCSITQCRNAVCATLEVDCRYVVKVCVMLRVCSRCIVLQDGMTDGDGNISDERKGGWEINDAQFKVVV